MSNIISAIEAFNSNLPQGVQLIVVDRDPRHRQEHINVHTRIVSRVTLAICDSHDERKYGVILAFLRDLERGGRLEEKGKHFIAIYEVSNTTRGFEVAYSHEVQPEGCVLNVLWKVGANSIVPENSFYVTIVPRPNHRISADEPDILEAIVRQVFSRDAAHKSGIYNVTVHEIAGFIGTDMRLVASLHYVDPTMAVVKYDPDGDPARITVPAIDAAIRSVTYMSSYEAHVAMGLPADEELKRIIIGTLVQTNGNVITDTSGLIDIRLYDRARGEQAVLTKLRNQVADNLAYQARV